MQFRVGYGTDIGRKRSQNQDNFAALPEVGLFMVADGMGGHKGGETASTMSVDIVTKIVLSASNSPGWDPHAVITEAIASANQEIFRRSSENKELQGMGTTTSSMLFKDGRLTIGHVGDSRCYFYRDGNFWQVTRDHSLVQEKLRAGLISRAQLKTDRMRNVITRSVGFESGVNVELYDMNVRPGDCFLICSDGLSGMVEDTDMRQIIQNTFTQSAAKDPDTAPQLAVEALIAAANQNGGEDNVTVVMAEVAP